MKKSVVRVHFPYRDLTCSYYNDQFDLHRGDVVYVDGKLEGVRGVVVDVSYTFKIKLSDYKRVISKADFDVKGEFIIGEDYLVTFDKSSIPFEKVLTWVKAPSADDEEYVSADDSQPFLLSDLNGLQIRPDVAQRGKDYYLDNCVLYISVVDGKGCAIVEGSQPYVVEFLYNDGEISNLVCNCYCTDTCKHEFATMLQLRDIIDFISKYSCARIDNFSAISKDIFKAIVINNKTTGKIVLE